VRVKKTGGGVAWVVLKLSGKQQQQQTQQQQQQTRRLRLDGISLLTLRIFHTSRTSTKTEDIILTNKTL
jgi:hypothetical protein